MNSMKIPFIYLNIRRVFKDYGYISSYALYFVFETILNNIIRSSTWNKLTEYLKRVKGVSIMGFEVRFSEE